MSMNAPEPTEGISTATSHYVVRLGEYLSTNKLHPEERSALQAAAQAGNENQLWIALRRLSKSEDGIVKAMAEKAMEGLDNHQDAQS